MREPRDAPPQKLKLEIEAARSRFDLQPGVLSGLPAAERAWRQRAVDAAIGELNAAEDRRRLFTRRPPADRQAYTELLRQLHQGGRPDTPSTAADPLTGLRAGDGARIELRLDCATPQELAALAVLVRTLAPGAVRVERLAAARRETAGVLVTRGA